MDSWPNSFNDWISMDDEQIMLNMILPTKPFWGPQSIIMDPTNNCNYSCLMCRVQSQKTIKDTEWTIQDYFTAMMNFKPRSVAVGATGEPLLCRDIDKIVSDLKRRKHMVILNTNASLLDKNIDWVANVDLMKISLDAYTPERYKMIRGREDFSRVINSVREIVNRRLSQVRFEYVVMSNNYEEMAEFVKFTHDVGADGAFFRLYQGFDLPDELNEELSNVPNIRVELERALKVANKLGVLTNLKDLCTKQDYITQRYENPYQITDDRTKHVCLLPWLQLFIRVDGESSFCCGLLEINNVSIGNVFTQENVWNSKAAIELRKIFLRKENYNLYDPCKSCEYLGWKQLIKWINLVPSWWTKGE